MYIRFRASLPVVPEVVLIVVPLVVVGPVLVVTVVAVVAVAVDSVLAVVAVLLVTAVVVVASEIDMIAGCFIFYLLYMPCILSEIEKGLIL